MISWWDVLKASKGLPVTNYYAQMWGKQLGGTGYVIAELTAPLPLTITTDGTELIDYRIYGNTENGESVGERTENLFDRSKVEQGYYYGVDGYRSKNRYQNESDYIPVEAGKVYTLYLKRIDTGFGTTVNLYDVSRAFYENVCDVRNPDGYYSVTPDIDGYIRFNETPSYATDYMFYEGSTAPDQYIPYGYKLPMVVTNGTATTTTPIYIGSDPLAEDEYVDFGEQKVYRMEGGTLTPTDPPTPIPALPTTEGETTIEYDGGEPQPEQMYVKYRRKD